jgi:hypothetical protein
MWDYLRKVIKEFPEEITEVCATPAGDSLFPPINKLTNRQGYKVPFRRLTIAWHRSPNLGNLLSYWKLENQTRLKVLLFLPTT